MQQTVRNKKNHQIAPARTPAKRENTKTHRDVAVRVECGGAVVVGDGGAGVDRVRLAVVLQEERTGRGRGDPPVVAAQIHPIPGAYPGKSGTSVLDVWFFCFSDAGELCGHIFCVWGGRNRSRTSFTDLPQPHFTKHTANTHLRSSLPGHFPTYRGALSHAYVHIIT